MTDPHIMSMWTLFDSPTDKPGYFVLRRFEILRGEVLSSPEVYWSKDPEALRDEMRKRALYCQPRMVEDEPHIVETWF